MMNRVRAGLLAMTSLLLLTAWLTGCSQENKVISDLPDDGHQVVASSCVGCHTDQAMLQSTADPEVEPPPSSGEG